ncbi:MAG: hypothetical protein AABW51_00985 [Nanoarchaeota archaeon]
MIRARTDSTINRSRTTLVIPEYLNSILDLYSIYSRLGENKEGIPKSKIFQISLENFLLNDGEFIEFLSKFSELNPRFKTFYDQLVASRDERNK